MNQKRQTWQPELGVDTVHVVCSAGRLALSTEPCPADKAVRRSPSRYLLQLRCRLRAAPHRWVQAPKKDKKELDEEDVAFKERKKQEEAALKAARAQGTMSCVRCYRLSVLTFSTSCEGYVEFPIWRWDMLSSLMVVRLCRRCPRWWHQEVRVSLPYIPYSAHALLRSGKK